MKKVFLLIISLFIYSNTHAASAKFEIDLEGNFVSSVKGKPVNHVIQGLKAVGGVFLLLWSASSLLDIKQGVSTRSTINAFANICSASFWSAVGLICVHSSYRYFKDYYDNRKNKQVSAQPA